MNHQELQSKVINLRDCMADSVLYVPKAGEILYRLKI